MATENVFWMFSASAQAIAALFAFLLAGVALVQAMMESARQRDDTLVEIHERLKRDHYARIIPLAVLACAAILLSLMLLLANDPAREPSLLAVALVAALDVAAIVASIWFVVWIIDPERYQRAAKELVGEKRKRVGGLPEVGDSAEFFVAFVRLEKAIRAVLRRRRLYVPSQGAPRMSYSFRQMTEALYHDELITPPFYDELQEINRYRNIIFHGHEDRADDVMVERAGKALEEVKKIDQSARVSRKAGSRRTTRQTV